MDFDFNTIVDEYYHSVDAEKHSMRDTLIVPALNIKIDVTRLHWKNVDEYLECIARHPKHFLKFLKKELNWNIYYTQQQYNFSFFSLNLAFHITQRYRIEVEKNYH